VTVEESIYIDRLPEVVYAIVRDLERAPEWQDSLESVDVQRGTEVRRFAGRRQEARFFVVDDEAPRLFAIQSNGGPAEARASFELQPHGDGTRVVFVLDLKLRGAVRFAGRVVKPATEREVRRSLEHLKELAEA
jgi:carbon monoxide dehydrogenase subunit G